jgi:hypothetical protein
MPSSRCFDWLRLTGDAGKLDGVVCSAQEAAILRQATGRGLLPGHAPASALPASDSRRSDPNPDADSSIRKPAPIIWSSAGRSRRRLIRRKFCKQIAREIETQ